MNIFVANINYRIEDEDLKQLFQEYGAVDSAKIIYDRETGRSRGFGFVEMPVQAEAEKAIKELDQFELEGKVISVNEAKPREERPRRNNNRY